jgi:hypothetical protein
MKSVDEVARILSGAGAAYALIGGHAVNAVLEPRFTADIDVTISAEPAAMLRVGGALVSAGFHLEREHGATQPSGPDFVRFVDDDGTVLELQTAKTALQRSAIARANDHDGVRVATPEDLIVFKAIANRPKDQIDLLGLVRLPGLDWTYVDDCARDWGVESVIARVRALATSAP